MAAMTEQEKAYRSAMVFKMDSRRFMRLALDAVRNGDSIEKLTASCQEEFAEDNAERPDAICTSDKTRARLTRVNSQLLKKGFPQIAMPHSERKTKTTIENLWDEFGDEISELAKKKK